MTANVCTALAQICVIIVSLQEKELASLPTDEDAFRNRALDLALAQLAVLFTEFQGMMRHDLRFELLSTQAFRLRVAEAFSEFIAEAPVETINGELAALMRPGQHSIDCRQINVDSERTRLEQAGLIRRHSTPGGD